MAYLLVYQCISSKHATELCAILIRGGIMGIVRKETGQSHGLALLFGGTTMPELFTVDEVAALLKVAPITIRVWLSKGRLDYVKVGRSTRIRREALEAIITQPVR
jgi:excisionase family DNA binding protein